MDNFRIALEECELHDLGFAADMFTWRNNCHNAEGYNRERLDRGVANKEWQEMFPDARVVNGDLRQSDHRPVIITIEPRGGGRSREGGQHCFRFEAAWLEEEMCPEVVESAWKEAMGSGRTAVLDALKVVAGGLGHWSRNILGDLEKK
jgi:hypothetical protein